MVFSVDSYEKEEYEKIRVNGKFETILTNIKKFKEIRDEEYPNSTCATRIRGVKYTKEQNTKLVFIGRFDELKNVENIALSMKYLLNEDVVLDIYGKGPDLTSIEQAISENNLQNKVKLKGIDKDIANKLSNYDALIIASTHDAFPNVLIEAMNAGVVPISTKVGDCEWLLSENRGIFINGFDPESISLSIKKFYEMDLNKKNEIIKNGRNLINQNLSEEKILKDWLEILF